MTTHFQPSPTYGDERYQPEDGPAPPHRDGGPPRRTLAEAVRRHWLLALIPVVLLAAAGAYAGKRKPPTYSAMATINVGKSDIATQATPGYELAAEALASSYSRLVTSQNITVPAARAAGQSPASAAGLLSSTPIPNEPTFTITAKGTSAARATALAKDAVTALQHYVSATATQSGGPAQLLTKYQAAEHDYYTLQHKVSTLLGKQAKAQALGTPSPVKQSQLTDARVAAQTAQIKANALSSQYQNLSSSGVAPTLSVLVSPTGAVSTNRTTNMEKYGVIGAVAGVIIGLAFAGLGEAIGPRRRRATL